MNNYYQVDCTEKEYSNFGNKALLTLLNGNTKRVLDVGCGAGDNARLIKNNNPDITIHGITLSEKEKNRCLDLMEQCLIANIENGIPEEIIQNRYDTIIFSHVLEHVKDPAKVVESFFSLLNPNGEILIAVPNILVWKQRIKFMLGRFEYTQTGIMDFTHLKFFTYYTADKYLLGQINPKTIHFKTVEGAIPLWIFRRFIFPKKVSKKIDSLACKLFPNLFGHQILLKAIKK
jgi:2-polyprenyl-3-methyl-5-hydroxy-6-metoxy-1,4-benzoquinol methylase